MRIELSSYRRAYRREVEERLSRGHSGGAIEPSELLRLPQAVRRYLESTGDHRGARVENLRAKLRGQFRRGPSEPFMPFEAEQHNFFGERPARLFLMRATQHGIPFQAFHRYADGRATMRVKVASALELIDASGPEMDQSETVTQLNDMCLLAPATLVDPRIEWQELEPLRVAAKFTNAGVTISAVLTFDASGALTNFWSDDRYLSADGKSYAKYRWSTPITEYRELAGRRSLSRGEATWALPEGEYSYVRLEVVSLEYNLASDSAAVATRARARAEAVAQ